MAKFYCVPSGCSAGADVVSRWDRWDRCNWCCNGGNRAEKHRNGKRGNQACRGSAESGNHFEAIFFKTAFFLWERVQCKEPAGVPQMARPAGQSDKNAAGADFGGGNIAELSGNCGVFENRTLYGTQHYKIAAKISRVVQILHRLGSCWTLVTWTLEKMDAM